MVMCQCMALVCAHFITVDVVVMLQNLSSPSPKVVSTNQNTVSWVRRPNRGRNSRKHDGHAHVGSAVHDGVDHHASPCVILLPCHFTSYGVACWRTVIENGPGVHEMLQHHCH